MNNSRSDLEDLNVEIIEIDGLRVAVRQAGATTADKAKAAQAVLLLHGFPHTHRVWQEIEPALVFAGYHVVTPDLRGVGSTDVSDAGFDALSLARDQVRLLDALQLPGAHVVGLDFGAAPAFALAAAHPERVRSLTIVEAVIGGLPGAETFLAAGPPWWFGFHQTPGGLAEDIVAGNEDRYVRFFLQIGSRVGVPSDLEDHFVDAYTGRGRLRAAFEHYRAMPSNAAWNQTWAKGNTLSMPVTAVGASTVQDAPARQLSQVARDFVEWPLPDSGHMVPIDAPDELAAIIIATAQRANKTP